MPLRLLAIICALSGGMSVSADKAVPAAPAKPDNYPSFTPEREAAALAFVSAHHPELRKVLEPLKVMQPGEYESAICQLFQTSEQLSRTKDADESRYAVDLQLWKVRSRIQLLVARAGLSEDPSLDKQIEDLLGQQIELRIARIELEKERAKERVSRLEAQLERLKVDQVGDVEKQFANLMRGVNRARAQHKTQQSSPQ